MTESLAGDKVASRVTPSRWINRGELLILAIGIGLRLARFLEHRPLWLDEALLSLNILSRPLHSYFRPLDHNQVSTLGFLWGEWAVIRLGGTGERALRFLPLVAAIAALIAFARLARRILDPWMALFATTLVAGSPLLIFYSAEVKSYGFDWLCAIVLMHATLTVAGDASHRAWMRWSLAAAFSAFMSTAAPFFVAGSALALLVAPPMRRDLRALVRVAVCAAPAAFIFGLQLLTLHHSSSVAEFMKVYWTEAFLEPHLPGAMMQAARFARELWSATLFGGFEGALPTETTSVVLAVSVVGALTLGSRSRLIAVLLLAPAAFAGLASLAKWWPLTPRLLLFAVPAVVITLAAGLPTVARVVPARARTPLLALISIALIAAVGIGRLKKSGEDERFIAVPEALREVATHAGPDATVYLSADMEAACIYYLRWHPDHAELDGDQSLRACRLGGRRTVIGRWPMFVGLAPGAATSAAKTVRPEWLDSEGRRILEPPATEVWVLIAYPDLRTALPSWLALSGATILAEREARGIRILTYRP